MSPQISEELMLLLMSAYGGLVLVVCYDVIRIFRRIFTASIIRVLIEDIIFWTVASIFMFNILLKYNYGRPRYFAVGTALGTMALFEWIVGRYMVDKSASVLKKIINTLLKPLKKIIKMIKLKHNKVISYFRKRVKRCQDKEERHKTDKEKRHMKQGQEALKERQDKRHQGD